MKNFLCSDKQKTLSTYEERKPTTKRRTSFMSPGLYGSLCCDKAASRIIFADNVLTFNLAVIRLRIYCIRERLENKIFTVWFFLASIKLPMSKKKTYNALELTSESKLFEMYVTPRIGLPWSEAIFSVFWKENFEADRKKKISIKITFEVLRNNIFIDASLSS